MLNISIQCSQTADFFPTKYPIYNIFFYIKISDLAVKQAVFLWLGAGTDSLNTRLKKNYKDCGLTS